MKLFILILFVFLLLFACAHKKNTLQKDLFINKSIKKEISHKEKILNYYQHLRLNKGVDKKQKRKSYIRIKYTKIKKTKNIPRENLVAIEQKFKYACFSKQNSYSDKTNKLCLQRVEESLKQCIKNKPETHIQVQKCLKKSLYKN